MLRDREIYYIMTENKYVNHSFYKLEKINYRGDLVPLFDGIIDVCYILYYVPYVERYNKIIDNLNRICFCKETYVCWNVGYKKTDKILYKRKSNYDLIDSYRYVFHDFHYKRNRGGYVLVLEDDFILEDSIFYIENIKSISKYLLKRKRDEYVYSLGCIPHWNILVPIPFYYQHPIFIKSTDSHANIYSNEVIKRIVNDETLFKEEHIDKYLHNNYWIRGFDIPLITQLKCETENTQNWPDQLYLRLKPIYEYLNLDISTRNYILFYYYGRLKFLCLIYILGILLSFLIFVLG